MGTRGVLLLWLEGAGPQLGGEVLTAVQFTVTLQDVDRLETQLDRKKHNTDSLLTKLPLVTNQDC